MGTVIGTRGREPRDSSTCRVRSQFPNMLNKSSLVPTDWDSGTESYPFRYPLTLGLLSLLLIFSCLKFFDSDTSGFRVLLGLPGVRLFVGTETGNLR